MSPLNYMDIFSRILNYYVDNKVLPNFVYTTSLNVVSYTPKTVTYPDNVKPYLEATQNCNSKDPAIISLAKKIVGNETSMYNKAYKIFEWVRINTSYFEPMYYNTRFGASKMLKTLSGNVLIYHI